MSEEVQPSFEIQRVYVKDLSLETKETPKIFLEQWQPATHIDLNIEHADLGDGVHEVILRLTVEVKHESKVPLLIEVKQAGVFLLKDFEKEQMEHMLKAYCPNILFPYAREVVSDMSTRSTFPPINLAPINFDALFMQQKEQAENAGKDGGKKGN